MIFLVGRSRLVDEAGWWAEPGNAGGTAGG